MKRLLLVLFAGLLLNVHVFAQWEDYEYYEYDDSGDYDDSEYDDSEYADYDDQTDVTIMNTGDENSSVDIQSKKGNPPPINIYFYNNVQQPTAEQAVQNTTPSPASAQPEVVERFIEQTPPVEYRYTPPPPPPPIEYIFIPSPPVEYIYIPPPPVEYIYVQPPLQPPPVVPIYLQPPVQVRVIPALPDPNSSRIYRLQVGAYAVHNTADMMAQRLRAAGLQAGIEDYNSLKRVYVPGVSAAEAGTVVQMLGLLGFEEVWIRE
jgi:cell division protein FtsN